MQSCSLTLWQTSIVWLCPQHNDVMGDLRLLIVFNDAKGDDAREASAENVVEEDVSTRRSMGSAT